MGGVSKPLLRNKISYIYCHLLQLKVPSNPSSILGLPFGATGKESACNVGDLYPTPGLGRSTGEGIGSAVQYFLVPLWLSW